LLEARESARAENESFEFTQLGRCRRAQRACNACASPAPSRRCFLAACEVSV